MKSLRVKQRAPVLDVVYSYLCQGNGGVKCAKGDFPVVRVIPNCIYCPRQTLQTKQFNVSTFWHSMTFPEKPAQVMCLPQIYHGTWFRMCAGE